MMQAVGRALRALLQRRQARTGTCGKGATARTLIQAERYLLACMVYIDLNPGARRHGRRAGRLSLVAATRTTSAAATTAC